MNYLRTTLLLGLLTGLLMFIGGLFGGSTGMIVALIFAAIMNFGAYWFSDTIVLKMYKAQEVTRETSPNLYEVVEELAIKAKIPLPKIYIVYDNNPNAFATGRNISNAAVAVTTGILQLLTRDELLGVMAHELTHVINRDTLISAIAATVAGAIGILANMLQWAAIFGFGRNNDEDSGGSFIGGIVMAFLAPIIAGLIQMAISRSREYAADRGGAILSGKPLALASALRKLEQGNSSQPVDAAAANPSTAHMFIVNPLANFKLANLFATHPSTEDRIQRLESMAKTGDYPL